MSFFSPDSFERIEVIQVTNFSPPSTKRNQKVHELHHMTKHHRVETQDLRISQFGNSMATNRTMRTGT